MTKNGLMDLNDHLFMELERLGNEDMTDEELEREIKRAHAIQGVAQQTISNANTMLSALKLQDAKMDANLSVPKMLTGGSDNNGR